MQGSACCGSSRLCELLEPAARHRVLIPLKGCLRGEKEAGCIQAACRRKLRHAVRQLPRQSTVRGG